MAEGYRKEIIKAYLEKKGDGLLSLNLTEPSPARLRDECLLIYRERYTEKDDAILRLFFGVLGKDEDYYRRIVHFDIEGFKPLANFLKGKTTKTEHKNIELLAWLIDFGQEGPKEETEQEKETELGEDVKPIRTHMNVFRWVGILFIALTMLMGIYWLFFRKQCMYWNGEEYVAALCDEKIEGVAVIALNKKQVRDFKKITRYDTLHYKDIGKVWYMNLDTFPQFYTDSGMHPVKNELQLKPITKYIIDKYILKKVKDTIVVNAATPTL